MTQKTEDELKAEAEKLATKAELITEKLEDKTAWTPEQITNLMTQLSAIQQQQATILEKLETLGASKLSTPVPPSVEEVDPEKAKAEQEAKALEEARLKAQQDKQNAPPKKHRLL